MVVHADLVVPSNFLHKFRFDLFIFLAFLLEHIWPKRKVLSMLEKEALVLDEQQQIFETITAQGREESELGQEPLVQFGLRTGFG